MKFVKSEIYVANYPKAFDNETMSEAEILFEKRGAVTAIANEMRVPIGTVWCWKRDGAIPEWRRPAVLNAVRRLDLHLPPEVYAYLATAA